MIKLAISIALFSAGCAVGLSDPWENQEPEKQAQRPAPKEEVEAIIATDTDACVPDRFASDNIPPHYKLDPSCPPEIYDPPHFEFPGNPGPVIK